MYLHMHLHIPHIDHVPVAPEHHQSDIRRQDRPYCDKFLLLGTMSSDDSVEFFVRNDILPFVVFFVKQKIFGSLHYFRIILNVVVLTL